MERFLWVCFAGALGSGARYLVSEWAASRYGGAFPVGTLLVNLAGCLLIAAIVQVGLATAHLSPTLRIALTAGFVGGLTTYSAFNHETWKLAEGGATGLAVLNVALTLVGCLGAGLVGRELGKLVAAR